MRAEDGGNGVGISRTPSDRPVVDDVLWAKLTAAVAEAAAATLSAPRTARIKADHTPVTDADECSQALLMGALARLMPGVAIVSEEAVRPSQLGNLFMLIDPLDGTREFVNGSPEYTVNLAIIEDREPAAGIVAVPAAGVIYRGRIGSGADRVAMSPGSAAGGTVRRLKVRTTPRDGVVAAVSRSHLDPATVAVLDRLHIGNRVPCGSALKFCRIAEGAADIYPRLAPTREWDVAAGHAVVVAAGGAVTRPDGGILPYGDAANDFRVPAFIAWGDRTGLLSAACK
ncbi:MAG: 3'(2'),5'-bisphosphate nucleotidase CysQ [Bradyrhizobiaceae bacterium]|nr:3'(2'),5'-bisphosphate nucleotidase CysQ [Bradyrhizobiaceae bacterium]